MVMYSGEQKLHNDLYGPSRNAEYMRIRGQMYKTHVPLGGPPSHHPYDTWGTSTKSDFVKPENLDAAGQQPVVQYKISERDQLRNHFDFAQGGAVSPSLYQSSVAQNDYPALKTSKIPTVQKMDNSTNWPDMAPFSAAGKPVGNSEARSSYLTQALAPKAPTYPKINTGKQPPVISSQRDARKQVAFDVQKRYETETCRSYSAPVHSPGRPSAYEESSVLADNANKTSKKSSIFRTSDYASKKRDENKPVTAIDYQGYPKSERDQYINYSKGHHPLDNTSVSLGSDAEARHTVYHRDYPQSGQATRVKGRAPTVAPPQSSYVMFQDPSVKWLRSVAGEFHSAGNIHSPDKVNQNISTAQMNAWKRHGNNVHLSCDPNMDKESRMQSFTHSSYDDKSLKQTMSKSAGATQSSAVYNYITADDALPYPGAKNSTEATTSFSSHRAQDPDKRLPHIYTRKVHTARREQDLGTNYIVGYAQSNHLTEHQKRFQGKSATASSADPAGVTEDIPNFNFRHFQISENTQEQPGVPQRTDHMEALHLRLRALARQVPAVAPFYASSLASFDYTPLERRVVTPAQQRLIDQNQQHYARPAPSNQSHIFRTEDQKADAFVTTNRADFIRPEMMSRESARASLRVP